MLPRGSDDLFTNAVKIRGRFSHKQEHQPKPDFWYGLGLYDKKQLSRLKGLEIEDKGIEYFTQRKLKEISTTRTGNLIYQPINSRSRAAFPWMVAEIKKEFGDEKECIRQAANAGHTSLRLSERLAAGADMDALPIVAFTSVGPKAKVFIVYKARRGLYVRPTPISRKCCPWFSIQHAKSLFSSVWLVFGAAMSSTFCILCNFDVSLISWCTGHWGFSSRGWPNV